MNRYLEAQEKVVKDITDQAIYQTNKWGFQRHTFEEWEAILQEEFAEFKCDVIVGKNSGYGELVHMVAVGLAWLVDIRAEDKK